MEDVAVPLLLADPDRFDLEVGGGRATEPSDDLDLLAGEIVCPEQAEQPFPDSEGLSVVEEEDPCFVLENEILGPEQARNAPAEDLPRETYGHRPDLRDLDLVEKPRDRHGCEEVRLVGEQGLEEFLEVKSVGGWNN